MRKGKIIFGSTVELFDEATEKELVYGSSARTRRISSGADLIHVADRPGPDRQNEGDVVTFSAPDGGEKHLEVVEVNTLYISVAGQSGQAWIFFFSGFSRYSSAMLPMRCTSIGVTLRRTDCQ